MADRWEKLSHPAIVSVKDLFISSEIGEISCKIYTPFLNQFTFN